MKRKEEPFEEEQDWEKRKPKKGREAGIGSEGELSPDALKRWLLWAGMALGICLIVGVILAAVANSRNKKEAAWLEADFGESMRFQLNRKGKILAAEEGGETLVGLDLERGLYGLLDLTAEKGYLSEGSGVLITVWEADSGLSVDVSRFLEELEVYAETGLKKRQSNLTIYAAELLERDELEETAARYGISLSRAAFLKGLIDKNISVKLQDEERLAGLSLSELLAEVSKQRYKTSFDVVTAKKIYGKKEETVVMTTVEEASEETDNEKAPESGAEAKTDEETVTEASEELKEAETEAENAGKPEDFAEESRASETKSERVGEPQTVPAETRKAETAPAPTTGVPAPAEMTQAPMVTPITPATAPTEPETTVPETVAPETTAAPLEILPISPAETSPEGGTSAPHQVVPENPQGQVQVYEVVPVSPGNVRGPGY